jgi:hypothetical protein
VIAHAVAHRGRYGRVAVLVGARTPGDLLYVNEFDRWREAGVDVRVTVDRADSGWTGRVGVVTTLLEGLPVDPAATTAFVCGPEVMMRFAALALLDRGVAATAIRVSLERNMRCGIGLCGLPEASRSTSLSTWWSGSRGKPGGTRGSGSAQRGRLDEQVCVRRVEPVGVGVTVEQRYQRAEDRQPQGTREHPDRTLAAVGDRGLAPEQAYRHDAQAVQQLGLRQGPEEPCDARVEHVDRCVAEAEQMVLLSGVSEQVECSGRHRICERLLKHGAELAEGARALRVDAARGPSEVECLGVG